MCWVQGGSWKKTFLCECVRYRVGHGKHLCVSVLGTGWIMIKLCECFGYRVDHKTQQKLFTDILVLALRLKEKEEKLFKLNY